MTLPIALPRPDWLARLRSVMVLRPGQRVAHVPGIGVRASRRAVSSGASNGLLNTLIAHWSLNETSGTRYDNHSNAYHLSDNNTVGYATGKLGNAASFVSANYESLSIASNSDLSAGDVAFTVAAWANIPAKVNGTFRRIVSKENATTAARCYGLFVDVNAVAVGNIRFSVYRPTEMQATVAYPATGWHLLVGWHDPVANTVNIQMDNGAVSSTATITALQAASDAPFWIGGMPGNPALEITYFNSLIDDVAFWKRTLSDDERTALWNSGAGLAYADFTA